MATNSAKQRPIALPAELQDVLRRNGMSAQVAVTDKGFSLLVQGHDSPALTYPISGNQLKALTGSGGNYANKKAYNTFASIVASDFDMPKDYVHARNANGRVAMGLHGYRIGVGEYGRPDIAHGHPRHVHLMGPSFLGWTPRMQDGWHLRRIGNAVLDAGAPMVANRPDGSMRPGELASGGYGFYYNPKATAELAQQDVLQDLQIAMLESNKIVAQRQTEPALKYKDEITSDVYFTKDKWLEVLKSHGLVVNEKDNTLTVQSTEVEADLCYDLTEEEMKVLASDSIKDHSIGSRLAIINKAIAPDFFDKVTMDNLNSDKQIGIKLNPQAQVELDQQLHQMIAPAQAQQFAYGADMRQYEVIDNHLPKGTVEMDGKDLAGIDASKGWFREGKNGREVTVDSIRVEPTEFEGKYKMTAVIDGESVSHEISQKQYDKFMAVDDFHRMKLFSKVFKEVDMKDRYPSNLGAKIAAGLAIGLGVTAAVLRGPRPNPEVYLACPTPRVYHKPEVDSPADVASRQFDAMVNAPHNHRGPGLGM